MRRIALLLALLTIPASMALAAAGNNWGNTVNGVKSDCMNGSSVGSSGRICFDFDSTLSPATTTFSVGGGSALACLRPDVAAAGDVGAATAVIYFCPTGIPTSTVTCGIQVGITAGVTLTGANGTPALQTACTVVGPGVYFLDVTALPAGAEVGLFTVQGGQ